MTSDVPPPPPGGGWRSGGDAEADPPAPPADQPPALATGPAAALPTAYASFGQRAGALLLDVGFVMIAVVGVVAVAFIVRLVLQPVSETLAGLLSGLVGLAGYLAVLITLMLMEAGPFGQTPGKHVVGIRVVDTRGQTISRGLAVGRYFAKIVSQLPCYLGYLWPLWDAEKRTFHDMIVSTRVIQAPERAPSLGVLVRAPYTGRTT